MDGFDASLGLLQDYLTQSRNVASNIEGAVDGYQRNLLDLDNAIEELHDRLNDIKRSHDNVDNTVLTLESVLIKFDVPRKVEDVLLAGKDADFEQYLQSYDKLVEANRAIQVFLSKNSGLKPAKEAAMKLDKLAQRAQQTLESMFRDTLDARSCIVDPKEQASERLRDRSFRPLLLHHGGMDTLLQIAIRLQSTDIQYLQHVTQIQGKTVLESLMMCYDKQYSDELQDIKDDTVKYSKGTHKYITSLLFLLRLADSELSICKRLVHPELSVQCSTAAFDDLVPESSQALDLMHLVLHKAVAQLLQQGQAMVHHGKVFSDIVFVHLDIVENLATNQSVITSLRLDQYLAGLGQTMRQNALRMLLDYTLGVETNDVKCSSDGVVHQLTTNTMHFLIRLFDYTMSLQEILRDDPSLRTGTGSSPLQKYVLKLLSTLESNLQHKVSHQLKHHKELSIVFLLNNYHYIHRSLLQSQDLGRLAAGEASRLETVIQDLQTQYLNASWGTALAILDKYAPEIDRKLQKHKDAGLSSSTKDLIKQMFQQFFEEFDSKYHQQLHFNIPEEQLRSTLYDLVQIEVLPKFNAVAEKYGCLPFSSRRSKYIKYDSNTLQAMLTSLFRGHFRKG